MKFLFSPSGYSKKNRPPRGCLLQMCIHGVHSPPCCCRLQASPRTQLHTRLFTRLLREALVRRGPHNDGQTIFPADVELHLLHSAMPNIKMKSNHKWGNSMKQTNQPCGSARPLNWRCFGNFQSRVNHNISSGECDTSAGISTNPI